MDNFIAFCIATVFFIFMLSLGAFIKSGYPEFVKEHNKTPFCVTKEVGADTVKRCYIAVEVKE